MSDHAHRMLLGKILRFGLIGGTSTVLFATLTWLLVEKVSLHPVLATIAAYALLLVPNFIAHKYFTFMSAGVTGTEWRKFLTVHMLNIGLSAGGMALIFQAQPDYRWGILFSAVVVPGVVFVAMNIWVFRTPAAH